MLIKYSGKYVKIYFNMKITFFSAENWLVAERVKHFTFIGSANTRPLGSQTKS